MRRNGELKNLETAYNIKRLGRAWCQGSSTVETDEPMTEIMHAQFSQRDYSLLMLSGKSSYCLEVFK